MTMITIQTVIHHVWSRLKNPSRVRDNPLRGMRACASNRVALAVPCHRAVRGDGDSGGYRWGEERKRRILELESR